MVDVALFPYGYRLLYVAHFFWAVAYAAIIARSQRDRLFGMPVLIAPINLFWEFNALTDCWLPQTGLLFSDPNAFFAICNAGGRPGLDVHLLSFYNELGYMIVALWLVLDAIIVLQCFWYSDYGTRGLGAGHWPVKIAVAVVYTYVAAAAVSHFMASTADEGGFVAAWLINLAMSLLFVGTALLRPNGRGLSYIAAWSKMIGSALVGLWALWTVSPVLELPYLKAVFALVFVADVAYIALLARSRRTPARWV
jgi:hypothetical protein